MAIGPINTVGKVPVQPSDPAEVDDKATASEKKMNERRRRIDDPHELLSLQSDLQKWTLNTDTRSGLVQTTGDQLKDTVKKIEG